MMPILCRTASEVLAVTMQEKLARLEALWRESELGGAANARS